MTNPTIRGRKIRQTAAAFGIALAALTLSTAAQADRGDRNHRGRDATVHANRAAPSHQSRSVRSIRRDSHAYARGANGRHRGYYNQPRARAGFFPRHRYYSNRHFHAAGRGCRIVRQVRFGHYGRRFITKRWVCYGRHGR